MFCIGMDCLNGCLNASLCSPNLTWRDLQHIVVLTAKQANLEANDWTTNAVGRKGESADQITFLP